MITLPWTPLRGKASAFLLAVLAFLPLNQVAAQLIQTTPEVRESVRQDVSVAVRDMPLADQTTIRPHRVLEVETIPGFFKNEAAVGMDAAMQRKAGKPFAAKLGLNFDGVPNVDGVAPPDTNGYIGDTQYVQWVNLSFSIFDKKTGKLLKGPVAGQSLWKGFGGLCQNSNDGDILVTYDKQAKRWLFTQFALTGPALQCFAVSTSSDATGTFNRYAFTISTTGINDYPKIGVWPDGYYMSFNIFGNGAAKVCSFERSKMLTGAKAASVCFQRQLPDFSLVPSDLDGQTPPPVGEPNFFVELDQDQKNLDLYKFHVDFKTPNKSTFIGPTKIAIKPWKQVHSITEPKPGEALDSLGDRLMYRLAYRKFSDHEGLTAAHSVDRGDGAAGIRWYEIRTPSTTPALFQQGTFVDPGKVSVWMPGMAMDKVGNIALGLSRASSAVKPGVSMTGRVPTDPVGTMGTALTVIAGTGVQQGDGGRWGDYTSMSVDPLDDCTFWFTTEYGKITGSNWATRVVSAKFPTCK